MNGTYKGQPGYIPLPGLDRYVNAGDQIDTASLTPEDQARLAPLLTQAVAPKPAPLPTPAPSVKG